MKDIKKQAAFRLRQVMAWLKMDRAQFLDYLGGIQSSRLTGWLKGDYLPPVEFMMKIKHDKKVSLDWIYDGDGKGQVGQLTEELEAIEPPPLKLKPRKKKPLEMRKRGAA